ncbi:hypothetical protein Cgig2_029535 [Carnegiea gigantea]|uniref:FHA domain-containing protein n=1 Tax=Carnegiea gigantea TaxID=171969 RepID=A0A9Q1KKR1_9CARY|nr:hypothetical protein Cgig2_029535 [Carnegiea gigantea]
MADRGERKIPVFSVWKNNVILKNIFLIDAPPSIEPHQHQEEHQQDKNRKTHQEFEETLMVGRHPDCDIRLEHPSISRFHLRIHSIPSSNLLFLTDLSSVHGTRVSGKRVDPNVRTRFTEADTLRIGGSRRIYKLHWIPLSEAYDMERPFVPPLDFPEPLEDEEEEEIVKDEKSSGSKNEDVHLVDSVSNGLNSSISRENEEMMTDVVIGGPSLQVNTVAVKHDDVELVNPNLEGLGSLFGDENSDICVQKEISQSAQMQNENSQIHVNKDSDSESSFQDANSEMCVDKELLMQDENSEALENGLESLFEDQNSEVLEQKEIPIAPEMQDEYSKIIESYYVRVMDSALDGLMPLFMGENWEWVGQQDHLASPAKEYYPLSFKLENEVCISSVSNGLDDSFLDKTSKLLAHEYIPSAPPIAEHLAFHLAPELDSTLGGRVREGEFSAEMILENEKQIPLHEDVQDDAWNFWYGSLIEPPSPPAKEALSDTQNQNVEKENQCPQHESGLRVFSERGCLERIDVEGDRDCKDGKLWSFWSGNMGVKSVCSSLSDLCAFSGSENRPLTDGYQSPKPLSSGKQQIGVPLLTSEHNSARSIWSRRGKQISAPQILTTRTKGNKMRTDQENVKDEPISRTLFYADDQEEEEVFTPDKENVTPNTHRSMRKMAVLKEAKRSNSGKSSLRKMIGSPDIYYGDIMSPASDKENYSPKVLQKQRTVKSASLSPLKPLQLKERKEERVPFQPLFAELPQKRISETCIPDAAVRSGKSVNCAKTTKDKCAAERSRTWNVVVDTTTLLNKESRKALQLLAGLKGTQLIIPRIVIRELDCLKRQVSFFRRNSEVFSALEWIQDCMEKTQWWIHVQSSMEEGHPVAPTPPASPQSHFGFGTATSVPFSSFESRAEILSPTAEDHVLDYALCFRRAQNDGQLVLLSNDVTLKIKAMAEGLICEGAEEFRESLVNPFSERFLWADSSPRGQTWSGSDDIVLREKFYPSSLKMTPKAMDNVKGLKLILLHNSQYFERMTTSIC